MNLGNILVTGTPGTGKTTLCEKLIELYDLKYLSFAKYASKNIKLQQYWNKELQCFDLTDEAEDAV